MYMRRWEITDPEPICLRSMRRCPGGSADSSERRPDAAKSCEFIGMCEVIQKYAKNALLEKKNIWQGIS
ncbi:hypothetical protein CL3_03240 [butyrate-producing bacterium SM4/1]|nr:hypothetical protein CL3_03240 [butyrate-producing bacterium SM4/1]